MTPASPSPPSDSGIYFTLVSSAALPNAQAHSIQILRTARALALRGDVRGVTVWAVTAPARAESVWEYYGLPPAPSVRIKAMRPGWLFRGRGAAPKIKPGDLSFALARRRILAEVRDAARRGPAVVLTRSQAAIDWLAPGVERLGATFLFELHWLKSIERVRGYLTKAAAKLGRPPRIGEIKAKLRAERAAERARLERADGVLYLTARLRNMIAPVEAPAAVLPSGVDFESARAEVEIPWEARDLDILYVGQLYPWKGVETLIEAMIHLPARRLTVAGGNRADDLTRLRALAERLGVADRIDFLGHLPHPEIGPLIRRARVCVATSASRGALEARNFTSPMKVFEIAARGRPLVATDTPAMREALTHGRNALLVTPDNPAALAAGIAAGLADPELRARLETGALELAAARDYSVRAERIVAFARGVIDAAASRGNAECARGEAERSSEAAERAGKFAAEATL